MNEFCFFFQFIIHLSIKPPPGLIKEGICRSLRKNTVPWVGLFHVPFSYLKVRPEWGWVGVCWGYVENLGLGGKSFATPE